MIVFMAGNFDTLIYGEKEKAMKDRCMELGHDYNRLCSYFEAHRINSLIELKKEAVCEERKPKLKKRNLKNKHTKSA